MNDFLPLVLFGLNIVCASISAVSAVISYLNAKKPASVELQGHVDELLALVGKMMKEQRKEKMSRVRNATENLGNPPVDTQPAGEALPLDNKTHLRQLARQKGFVR